MDAGTVTNTVLASGAAVVALRTHYLLQCSSENGKVYIDKATLYYAGLMLMAAAMWPVMWDAIVGYENLRRTPLLLVSILWVPCVIILDILTSLKNRGREHRDASAPSSQPVPHGADLRATIASLISGSFSIGILMFNSRKTHETTRLIMFGLLIMLGVVLPSFHVPAEPTAALIVKILQIVLSHFAIGLLITGMIYGLLTPPPNGTEIAAPTNPFGGARKEMEGGGGQEEEWRVGRGGLFCEQVSEAG